MAVSEESMKKLYCNFTQTNSTVWCGWLKKSNLNDSETKEATTKKKLRDDTICLLEDKIVKYSQHLTGDKDDISEASPKIVDLSDSDFSNLAFTLFPYQTTPSFKIAPLPKE